MVTGSKVDPLTAAITLSTDLADSGRFQHDLAALVGSETRTRSAATARLTRSAQSRLPSDSCNQHTVDEHYSRPSFVKLSR